MFNARVSSRVDVELTRLLFWDGRVGGVLNATVQHHPAVHTTIISPAGTSSAIIFKTSVSTAAYTYTLLLTSRLVQNLPKSTSRAHSGSSFQADELDKDAQ